MSVLSWVKNIVKWILIFWLISTYLVIYIVMWLLSGLAAEFRTKVGLWGEFFPTEERRKRDRIHQEELRLNMNFLDKFFLILFRLLKNW
jgi:hypothetical protein